MEHIKSQSQGMVTTDRDHGHEESDINVKGRVTLPGEASSFPALSIAANVITEVTAPSIGSMAIGTDGPVPLVYAIVTPPAGHAVQVVAGGHVPPLV